MKAAFSVMYGKHFLYYLEEIRTSEGPYKSILSHNKFKKLDKALVRYPLISQFRSVTAVSATNPSTGAFLVPFRDTLKSRYR
jgi:hypothetical protein